MNSSKPILRLPALNGTVLLLFVVASASAQLSSVPRDDFWVPDGPVNAMVETNGVIYIGGLFDYIAPVSETGNAFDRVSGANLPDMPRFNGTIKAVVPDNTGGWFVGGLFTSVGGFPLTNLVHINADRSVDTNWNPHPNAAVLALAASTSMLYVGGSFTSISGQAHSLLAALDPVTGNALSWQADCTTDFPNPSVNALVLAGNTLYVGGYFSSINGQLREHVGAVDATTGQLTAWYPNGYTGSQAGSRVDALAFADNVLYVGGTFSSIGGLQTNGTIRNFIAALDVTKDLLDSVLPWNPNADGPITSLAISCDKIYVGGSFATIGGQPRNRIAALDLNTGEATDWNPNADNTVLRLALYGNTLFVGGKFTQIGGQPRNSLAALDTKSGQATLWNPRADFGISGLGVAANTVIAGGALGPGGKPRQNAAAFDARTGQPLDWAPAMGGSTLINAFPYEGVYAIAASSTTIYLAGPFSTVNGQTRNHIAAVDAATGALKSWDPNADSLVSALAVSGSTIYAGGRFNQIGGAFRTNIAALSATTGLATSWNPGANDKVTALLRQGNTIYAGGLFTQIGGETRRRLAAISATSGAPTSWDPNVNDQVSSISILGSTLYLGGQFSTVGGQPRNRLAAVNLSTGAVNCWDPNAGAGGNWPEVNALSGLADTVYVAGSFSSLGGQSHNNLAALPTNCPAAVASWPPNPDSAANTVVASRPLIFAGGNFQNVGGQYRPNFAVFPPPDAPLIVLQPRSQIVTNGQSVTFQAAASGSAPLAYQWQFRGTNIPGATGSSLAINSAQVANSGDYTVVVTNALGLINSRPATLTVIQPLAIVSQPSSQTVAPGANVTLSVGATGSPPPTFQWRLNGVNIPGEVYSTLSITNAQPTNSGTYDVLLANVGGVIASALAPLIVSSTALPFADNLASRGVISGSSGLGSGNNQLATLEPAEPNHAGKSGGHSVWLSWTAPANGIATFNARGSSFDTLMGIYSGSDLTSLTNVANDDDRGGFATSQTAFNALGGTEYLIAIDGFAGAAGDIVLSWSLDTTTVPFPRIVNPPTGQTVSRGTDATFGPVAVNSPTTHTYQWYFGCRAIPNATNSTLVITNVQDVDVGVYHVVVANASTLVAQSLDAVLEIGITPGHSFDKLEDLLAAASVSARPLRGGLCCSRVRFLSLRLSRHAGLADY